jgi:signal transduction histidine kinase/DNA-binding response OmpR family regulator
MSEMRKLLIVCGLIGLPWMLSGQAPDPYRDPLDSLLEWLAPNLQDPALDSLAYRNAHIARNRALAEGNDTAIARSYLFLAEWHNYHGNMLGPLQDSAIYYDRKAIDVYRALGDTESVALMYYYTGLDLDGLGRYLEAEEAIFQSIALYDSLGRKDMVASNYVQLSDVLYAYGDTAKSIYYGEKGLELLQKLHGNAEDFITAPYTYLSNAYLLAGRYQDVLATCATGKKAYERVEGEERFWNPQFLELLENRGVALSKLGDYEEALQTLEYVRELIQEYDVYFMEMGNLLLLGRLKNDTGAHDEAMVYLQKAYRDGYQSEVTNEALFQEMALAFEGQGQMDSALIYERKANEVGMLDLTDRIKSLEREKLIKYETAQKEATIAAQEVRLQQQQRIQNLIVGIIALLILLLASLFWIFQNNRKRNQQLGLLNHELQVTNKQLSIAKEKAQAAEASAKEANETKSNFLSTVSHELRTPLTSVLGFTRIVRKRFTEKIVPALPVANKSLDRTVSQIEKNLDVVVQEGDRLTNLINDVLDLAKIESGRTEWRMEPLNINAIIQHAYHATESLFAGKGLTYREELADNLPTIHGDRDKLIQVLVNLFSNAVKFTDVGSVTVSSSLENDQVVVRVQDTGIGIASEDLGKVFEKFRQVGDTLTDKPQGTGLGLPICQEIIQHLNGDIWVESTPAIGSTFGFVLPTAKAVAEHASNEKLEALLDELRRKIPVSEKFRPQETHQHILVVDDEAGIRELLRQELIDLGYRVTLAEDGQKALQSIRQQRPDMIILDVMMPELNGFDLAAILKNDPKTVDIPILILSIVRDKLRGYKIGVDRYLHKPIDMDQLSREVASLMNGGKSTKKIMVVDEQDSAAKTISKALIAQGYQVIEADAQGLLDLAKSNLPDAIILNATMENQEEIVKALRFEKDLEAVLFLMYQ